MRTKILSESSEARLLKRIKTKAYKGFRTIKIGKEKQWGKLNNSIKFRS